MPNGGKITISTRNLTLEGDRAAQFGATPGRYISVMVGDSGPGMAEDVRARVFEPFSPPRRWVKEPASA